MASITWPSSLQQLLNQDSFSIALPQSWIESVTDIGPKKRRRRTTQNYEQITCTIWVDTDGYVTFKNFYDVTLDGGVLPFVFINPITQVLTSYRMAAPTISPLGGQEYSVSMAWEEVLNAE